jgi:hypothetical protein
MYEIDEDIKDMLNDLVNACYKYFGKYFSTRKEDNVYGGISKSL